MGNIILSGSAVILAGKNVATGMPESTWTSWISGSESFVNLVSRYNWSDAFATLNDDVRYVIADTVARDVAIKAINYDMSGYTTRIEAEDMVNILRDGLLRNVSLLRGQKEVTFINGA